MNKKLLLQILAILAITFQYQTTKAQQNALDFDNVDDEVIGANASATIANATAMSLSFWVYPTNANITFPDFDGFAGFRNNTNADFYIVQHLALGVEARFRNSAGTNYDIVVSNLVLNTWQHYVMTYNGSTLTLYRNGISVGSTPATGTITSTSQTLYMGNLDYQGTNFYHKGKLDEVSLWNKALTAQEVTCIFNNHIDASDPNLKLYYKFNQGITNGNNATINTVTNSLAGYSGTMAGFAKTGTTSNFVGGVVKGTVDSVSICSGETVTFGSLNITQAGNYIQAFPTASICDSIVELQVAVNNISLSVQQNTTTLTSAQAGGTYQWYNCNTNTPIANAVQQAFSPTANGSYSVIVTLGTCSDTSNCIQFTTAGINEINTIEASVYPNPFRNSIEMKFDVMQHNAELSVMDISGRIIFSKKMDAIKSVSVETENWNAGTYFVELKSEEGMLRRKLIKE